MKSGLVKLGKPPVFSCKIVLETINSTGKCLLRSMRKRAEKSFSHWLLFDQNSLSNNKGAPWWPLKRPSFIPSIVLDPLHLVDYGSLYDPKEAEWIYYVVFFTGCGNHITVSYWFFFKCKYLLCMVSSYISACVKQL